MFDRNRNRNVLRRVSLASALLLSSGLAAANTAKDPEAPVYDARSAFEALKAMEGEWVGTVSTDPEAEGTETTITYRVSANGHSLIETFAPGKPHEMFSVYHLDGDELLMTHYCAIGNAPKMKFSASGKPGELAFEFNGGTNLDPARDPHAHEGKRQLHGPDHYTSESVGWAKGKPNTTRYFSMRRKSGDGS